MNISQEILAVWTRRGKVRLTASGWYSGNAPCCEHNGESADKRSRGGVLPTPENGITFSCFNCGFTASWKPGRRINLKVRKLMGWMGFDEDHIRRLSLFALSQLDSSTEVSQETIKELPTFERRSPCPGKTLLDWFGEDLSGEDRSQLEQTVAYIDSRGIGNRLHQFYWSPDSELRDRVLIPYTFLGQPVGHTGRLIGRGKVKYLSDQQSNFVYNFDQQQPSSKFCVVVEGPFDAIAIDALAVMTNECSEQQALIVESLNRETIVVPDRDKAGIKLIRNAMDYGWNVAFPEWEPNVKDVSDAVNRYGQLYTLKSIIDSVETSNLKIQLMMKRWIS